MTASESRGLAGSSRMEGEPQSTSAMDGMLIHVLRAADDSHLRAQPALSPSSNRSSSSRLDAATPTTMMRGNSNAASGPERHKQDSQQPWPTPGSQYHSQLHQDSAPPRTPGASVTSPPRYATRASLGSVAFSPGKSPGSTSRRATSTARQNNEATSDLLPPPPPLHWQHAGSLGAPSQHLPSQHYAPHQYEYYAGHHASKAPVQDELQLDLSPEMRDLEAHLNDIAPATPNPQSILKEPTGSSLSASGKRRALPTPLDLSPPKPTRMRSQEQHPVVHGSPYVSSSDTSSRDAAGKTDTHVASFAAKSTLRNHTNESLSSPSTTGTDFHRHQPYAGLGLGLPFSQSGTSDSLASLASSSSSDRGKAHTYAGKLASPLIGDSLYPSSYMYDQNPSTSSSISNTSSSFTAANNSNTRYGSNDLRRQRSASDVLLSSPEEGRSPMVDRKGLVGLGELSTPRWTAAIHERRWNQHHPVSSSHISSMPTPRLPMHEEEENAPQTAGPLRNQVQSSEGGWEGSVLGNYMDEKENDAYATYRKSMPASDSYRSFSDVAAMDRKGTGDPMSTSSSAYSIDAMSVPESHSSSSSSSEAGAFYTPSLRPGVQQDPLASYQIPHHTGSLTAVAQNDAQHESTFKRPKGRDGNEMLNSSTTSTVLSPTTSKLRSNYNTTSSGGNSRTSSRSTTSSSVQSLMRKAAPAKEKERDVPSYMRGTAASTNKRTSVTSIDDLHRRQDTITSPSRQDEHSSHTYKIRHSSPPQQQLKNAAATSRLPSGRLDSTVSRQSGHSRQSSMNSNSGSRKHVPTPLNTARDGLPSSSRHHQNQHDPKQPTSASKVSKSPSAIAHHILQQTLQQGLQEVSGTSSSTDKIQAYEEFDISAYASSHLATSEALSKLDGISNASSPRISRALSTCSFKSSHTSGKEGTGTPIHDSADLNNNTPKKANLSRQNSKTSNRATSPNSRPSSSRKSWAHSATGIGGKGGKGSSAPSPGPSAVATKDEADASASMVRRKSEDHAIFAPNQTLQPPAKSPLRASFIASQTARNSASQTNLPRKISITSSLSSPSLPGASMEQASVDAVTRASATTNNNLSPTVNSVQPFSSGAQSRRGSGNRPSSSSVGDVPPTPSLSSKRSSSASLAFGTSTTGSRDSTSATSISAYGSPAQGKMSKSRRGSTSSDVSSVHSSGIEGSTRTDRSSGADGTDAEQAFARFIPPVPPLPKDWELYRPATTGGDSSVPTSASTSSFKERDASRISALQSLGVADYRPGQQGQISRSSSLEKPAGPRPLRDASSSSLSPATGNSPSLASISSLPSPAPPSTSSSNSATDRQQNASKTPTKSKWSLSNALGMNRSPTIPASSSQTSSLSSFSSSSLDKSPSYSALSSITKQARASMNRPYHELDNDQSELSRRKLASVPDIKSLMAGSASVAPEIKLQGLPHSASAHQIGGRVRTDSQSSASTANASKRSDVQYGLPASPGRSLSSLLSSSRKESSSRTTPSGIPFWNRRPSASHAHQPAAPLSPGSKQSSAHSGELSVPHTPAQGDEKAGRRSILGINLFGRSSARKSLTVNKDHLPPSPGLPQHYAASNRTSTASKAVKHDDKVSELGVRQSQEGKRNSVGARASSLISGRKRGKTLPSNTESPMKPESPYLPPMQMNALPPSTASRMPSENKVDTALETGTPQKRPFPVTSRLHRPSRVGDTLNGKANLPTITGSPSVAVNGSTEANTETSELISKPPTPTRIPRLTGSRSNLSSPQYLEAPTTPALDKHDGTPDGSQRRGSLRPGAGISSSVPDHSASYLKAQRDEVDHSSSSSSQETPASFDESETKLQEQPKRRVLGASTSQVPVLSSSRTSGKYQPAPVASTSEKRRSLVLSEKDDLKPTKTPLKPTQPTTASTVNSRIHPSSSATVPAATPVSGSARVRTKTLETPSTQRKTSSNLVDDLPASKSMGSSLVSKLSIPSRISKSTTTSSLRQSPAPSDGGGRSTSSSRYGTPVGEDEIRGDEEMLEFVQRQRTKQASRGMTEEEIDRLFTFPEPIEPTHGLTPQSALQLYRHEMCEYEMDEVLAYKEVYYVGRRDTKKMATKLDTTNNHGYDDDRGDYQIIEGDHIQYRYEIIDTLGKGSFGQVLRCRDHCTGNMVAVKIIRNKKRFHHQALVEIKVLENLKRWDPEEKNCLLVIGEHFTFRGHLCITTELLGINLYELIKANSFRGFSTTLIRRFTVQILAALSLLRHHRVVHCDLKPENILLKHPAKSAVKVIDFGSSCFENEKVYTYIQSRFYRSPEVILGMNYHMAIDMWSLGCILAELYTGMPIFPGENEASQLACIMEVLGVPDKHIVDRSSRKKLFFDSTGAPRPTVDSKGRRRRPGAKALQAVLKCDDELFVDFIAKCLTWDPDRRLKPGPALRHPFCAKGRTIASAPIPPRFSTTSTRSLLRPSNISTPRRLEKKPVETSNVYSTPSVRHDASIPSTAPVQRVRTISAAVPSSVGPAHNSYRSYAK